MTSLLRNRHSRKIDNLNMSSKKQPNSTLDVLKLMIIELLRLNVTKKYHEKFESIRTILTCLNQRTEVYVSEVGRFVFKTENITKPFSSYSYVHYVNGHKICEKDLLIQICIKTLVYIHNKLLCQYMGGLERTKMA